MNYDNKNESVIKNITNDIKQNFCKNECKDTGKNWMRNCPKCNREISYKDKYNCIYANSKNTNCMSCNATGKTHNIETIEKIRNKNKTKIVSQQTKDKLSKLNSGKKLTSETKLKIKKSLIGNKRMLGKHHFKDGKLKEKDIIRMNFIKESLQCKFFRYNESNSILQEY